VIVDGAKWELCAESLYSRDVRENRVLFVVNPPSFSPFGEFLDFDWNMFQSVARFVEMSSTPGWPWMGLGCNSNAQVFEYYPVILYQMVVDFLLVLLNGENDDDWGTVLRYFGKAEELATEKVDRKGCRLIANLPLHVLIAEMVVLKPLLDSVKDENRNRVQKPGMGLHDQGLLDLASWFKYHAKSGPLTSSDVSNWDFCVTLPMQLARVTYEGRLYGFLWDSDWCTIMRRYEIILTRCPIHLPDGKIYTRPKGCIMRNRVQSTGRLATATGNSDTRALVDEMPNLEELISSEAVATMGDDDVAKTSDPVKYVEVLQRYGIRVKLEEIPAGAYASFCSHTFWDEGWPTPQNFWRNLYSILGTEPTLDRLGGWLFTNRHHPLLNRGKEILDETGWTKVLVPQVVGTGV
jgi:hypothetical protein